MAFLNKALHHTRSISLPTRSHPVVARFDEDLSRLKSSQAASTSSSSIIQRLCTLQNLYNHLDELLLLPLSQKNISQTHKEKWVDLVLDGSLRFLDLCGIAKDALSQTKGCLQDIHSVLRRRFSGEMSIVNEVTEYLNTRKKVKKVIKSCMKDMKLYDKSDETVISVMLRDLETVSYDVFRSLFYVISGSVTQQKGSNWFVKLVHQSGDMKEADQSVNGFEALDEALGSLVSLKKTGFDMVRAESWRSNIVKLESEIQNLDGALDSLFRHLVKTRATLLNVLSN